MAWIKRNLFFVIGGVISLGLLGGASFYVFQNWTRSSKIYDQLEEVIGNLQMQAQQKPSPGNKDINNTAIAKEQERQLLAWDKSISRYFQPVEAIPAEVPVQSETYAASLRRTVDQLQHEANDAGVLLPKDYNFSFTAQRPLVKFAGSLEPLAVQLGEVKAIAEILFGARVYALDGIQRVRVSADDANGPQSDYTDQPCVTNDLATITPYSASFRCFTPELARIIGDFAVCSNSFIIQSVNVQPAGAMVLPPSVLPPAGMMPLLRVMPPGMVLPPGMMLPPNAAAMAAAAGKGGLQTILKEQLLRVTLELRLVKLLPKK